MTEEAIVRWVHDTVRLFGGQESTALRCAAEFAAAFERGEIAVRAVERAQATAPGAEGQA